MQNKVIFIRMVSHLDSLWNSGTSELWNGLLSVESKQAITFILVLVSLQFEIGWVVLLLVIGLVLISLQLEIGRGVYNC